MPQWLEILAIASLALGGLCAATVVVDLLRGPPQHMWIMDLVWPIMAALKADTLSLTAWQVRTWVISRKYANSHDTGSRPRPAAVSTASRVRRGDEYRRMLTAEAGLTRAAVARRLGMSQAAVTQALRRSSTPLPRSRSVV